MSVTKTNGNGFALYNGVKLPALPERDKEIYPYACITITYTSTYLWVSTMPLHIASDSGDMVASADGEVARCIRQTSGEWSSSFSTSTMTRGDVLISGNYLKWSNFDVLNDDGALYLSASDPIPLANQSVIEWDGVTEGLESTSRTYTYPDGTETTLTYYKVSDAVPTKAQLKGGYNVIDFHGTRVTSENTDLSESDMTGGAASDLFACVGFVVTADGIWFHKDESELGTDYTALVSFATVTADIDPVAFMTGFQLGKAIRNLL